MVDRSKAENPGLGQARPGCTVVATGNIHMQQIVDIYNYYVLNSTATFHLVPETLEAMTDVRKTVVEEQGLPYLVALEDQGKEMPQVLGYAYAKNFHGRPAYAATVELTIYLHPDATGRKIGRKLLRALVDDLRKVPSTENRPHGVREVMSVMTSDSRHPMDLQKFYGSEGFVEAGLLKNVGWKFGRWIDVAYWQLSLR